MTYLGKLPRTELLEFSFFWRAGIYYIIKFGSFHAQFPAAHTCEFWSFSAEREVVTMQDKDNPE